MEYWLFAICLFFFVYVRKVSTRVKELEEKIFNLNSDMFHLSKKISRGTIEPEEYKAPEPTVPVSAPIIIPPTPPSSIPLSKPAPFVPPVFEKPDTSKPAPSKPAKAKSDFNFEMQFGAKLPVWIGGIALALSGFYLVKYTIDNNLLTETVRVLLGFIFGLAMLGAAHVIRNRPNFANGTRISQALSGAGIADLYGTFFAATTLYHLIPSSVGFLGMAAVTATAIVLSLRHGVPIALIGLIGGFAAPGMIGSEHPSAITLFVYLYCVVTGMFAVMRHKGWWILAIPTLIGAFAWVAMWTFGDHYSATDSIWLGLFLLAVMATFSAQTRDKQGETSQDIPLLGYFAFGGAILLMSAITYRGSFGYLEWGFFALLGLGGIVMAYFQPKNYRFVPLLSMAVTLAMLAINFQPRSDTWLAENMNETIFLIGGFGLMYGICGLALMSRVRNAVDFAKLGALAAIGYFALLFATLEPLNQSSMWNGIAMILALVFVDQTRRVMQSTWANDDDRPRLLAVLTLTATGFLSAALVIHLPFEYVSIVLAAEILASGWLCHKLALPALRRNGKLLYTAFAFVLTPQVFLLLSLAVFSLTGFKMAIVGDTLPILDQPFFQLGLPAVMLAGASLFYRQQKDGTFVKLLEVSAIALGALMVYYITRHLLHPGENILFIKPAFGERGILTSIFFAGGLAAIYGGRKYARSAIAHTGTVLFLAGLFRVFFFDHMVFNPLWVNVDVGGLFLMNAMAVTYGLPLLWLYLEEKPALHLTKRLPPTAKGIAALALIFMLVTLNVRHFFHGPQLWMGETTSAEIYSYSFAWLLLGGALLFLGTLRQNKPIRVASMAIVILTVGKVFLYDASELQGLYRVFSFMGLGITLLAISWFYSRFVFTKEDKAE